MYIYVYIYQKAEKGQYIMCYDISHNSLARQFPNQ